MIDVPHFCNKSVEYVRHAFFIQQSWCFQKLNSPPDWCMTMHEAEPSQSKDLLDISMKEYMESMLQFKWKLNACFGSYTQWPFTIYTFENWDKCPTEMNAVALSQMRALAIGSIPKSWPDSKSRFGFDFSSGNGSLSQKSVMYEGHAIE